MYLGHQKIMKGDMPILETYSYTRHLLYDLSACQNEMPCANATFTLHCFINSLLLLVDVRQCFEIIRHTNIVSLRSIYSYADALLHKMMRSTFPNILATRHAQTQYNLHAVSINYKQFILHGRKQSITLQLPGIHMTINLHCSSYVQLCGRTIPIIIM